MRTIFILASAALISAAAFTGSASAEEALHLTPPLYREQAQASQQAHRTDILTTTPQPVPAAESGARSASLAVRSYVQASAWTLR